MTEKMIKMPKLEPTMADKEILNFEYLRNNCSYQLNNQQFDSIYSPLRQQIGINSPAVMLLPKVAQALGVNRVLGDAAMEKIVIAVNQEILPDPEYADYLLEHECWEVYIKYKEGFNLATAEQTDSSLLLLDRRRPAHRYSCYREFLLATKTGKADGYLKWWQDFYQQDRERVAAMSEIELSKAAPAYGPTNNLKSDIIKLIDSNQAIKEWAYQKAQETQGRELALADVA